MRWKKADGAFVYSIQLNQNKKIKASPPLGSLLRASSGVLNTSKKNISQPGEDVKRQERLSVEDRNRVEVEKADGVFFAIVKYEGGRMFINVRGKDVENASSKVAINRDLIEYYISSTGSYQKGFTKPELVAYLQDALGDGFTVETSNMFGAVSAVVTKETDSGIRFQDRNGIDNSSGKWNNKKHKKGSIYDEFASIAMSWANETGRKFGDTKKLYSAKNGGIVKIEADGQGGYSVIYAYTEKEYDELYGHRRETGARGNNAGYRSSKGRSLRDSMHIENKREYRGVLRQDVSYEQTRSDPTRNSDDSGRYSSFELNDVKLQERLDVEDKNRVEVLENKAKRLEGELKKLESDYSKAQDYARAEGVLIGQVEQGKKMSKEMRLKQAEFD